MNTRRRFVRIIRLFIGLALFGTLFIPAAVTLAQEGASLQTDKTVYLLGEPVFISGSGFTEGSTTVTVLRPDGVVINVPWLIWDDDVNFHTTHIPPRFLPFSPDYPDYTPGLIPGRYRVTATDGLNSAQTDYTVACRPPKDKDVGRIILVKQTVPGAAPEGFSFYIDYGAPFGYPNGLQMKDDASLDSGYVLSPGEYTIDEYLIPEGWQLSSIDIKDKSGGSYSSGSTTTVDLAGGETVTVTYTNTRIGATEAAHGVKVDLVEALAEENPTPPPLFFLSPGEVVGSVILNTTASGKLIVNVNMDTEPGLVDYDVIVRVFYSHPPIPPADVVGIFTDVLDTNAMGQGNTHVVVDIDPPSDVDVIFVGVFIREGPTDPPTPAEYFTGIPLIEVPLK